MTISLNYRFLINLSVWLVLATALLSTMYLLVLDHHAELVPLWGQTSMATDLIAFSFVVGFLLCFVATKLTHRAIKHKKVLPLHWHLKSQTLIDRLPKQLVHRSFMLGLAGVVLSCLSLLLFRLREIEQVPYEQYLLFFVVHAVSLAGGVTVMSVYRSLGDGNMLRKLKSKNQSSAA